MSFCHWHPGSASGLPTLQVQVDILSVVPIYLWLFNIKGKPWKYSSLCMTQPSP